MANDTERNFKNHLGASSRSTHLISTCSVINYVIIRPVNANMTVGRVRGVENRRKEVVEKLIAAGMKL